jgi:hypothetical protein
MAEWLKAAVLKTVSGVTRSGVRIPLPPPLPRVSCRTAALEHTRQFESWTVGSIHIDLGAAMQTDAIGALTRQE